MFCNGIRLPAAKRMRTFMSNMAVPRIAPLIAGVGLLVLSSSAIAQHGGGGGRGGGGMMGSGMGSGGLSRPDGVSDKDDLKDFHRIMAVQASGEQRAAFLKVASFVQGASERLQSFCESLARTSVVPVSSPLADREAAVRGSIEQARAGNENFLASFSAAQKSGLKDFTAKLAKAESELDRQMKMLDQLVESVRPDTGEIAAISGTLEKQWTSFQSQHLALGREMGILFPGGDQNLAFNLPRRTSSINLGSESISIPASGVVAKVSSEGGLSLFNFRLAADLSDLQPSVTDLLTPALTRSPRCGERIELKDATLTPLPPSSLVEARLHFERWICPPGAGPVEAAISDGAMEVRLTPSVDQNAGLRFDSQITRVEADGPLREMLRSGDLGVSLRDAIAASLSSTLQNSADLRAALPGVAQPSAILQKAEFQDSGAGRLNLLLEGQIKLSDEQTKQFAVELKQMLSAQGPATR